jgi:hypothetical protein
VSQQQLVTETERICQLLSMGGELAGDAAERVNRNSNDADDVDSDHNDDSDHGDDGDEDNNPDDPVISDRLRRFVEQQLIENYSRFCDAQEAVRRRSRVG